SYKLDLPSSLRRRGVHDVFHVSLLRMHEPNDDRLFPGRLANQISELEDQDNEWAINKLTSHVRSGSDAVFEAVWKSGDRTWVLYSAISHLYVIRTYLDLVGAD
ncbi:hypothetical protein WOLCODRAFT_43043, partial [Wolfiporia cocos MD-104 SS10]